MNHLIVKKTVLSSCIALIVYYFIMEAYYVYFITENYARFRFILNVNTNKYAETKILFVFVLILLVSVSKVSEFIYAIIVFFIVFFFVPTLITYSMSDQISGPLYSTTVLLFALGVITNIRIKVPQIKSVSLSNGVVLLLICLAMTPIAIKFGIYLNIENFLLRDISATREYYDENSSTYINYVYNWFIKAILPIVLIFFLLRKQYLYVAISVFLLLYLYIISGNKLVYITTLVMLFFFFVGDDYVEKIKYFLYSLLVGLLILPVLDYIIPQSHTLKGLFVMRMLFLPSQLNYCYFDFFYDNPLFFAESNFFNIFTEYPYDKPIGYVISQTYFNAPDMNANNGIIGDGFMNLGYLGVGINILIISLIFIFFNCTNPNPRYLGIFFVLVFLFLSVPMLSMFNTSGLWIIFLFALTIMKNRALTPKINSTDFNSKL